MEKITAVLKKRQPGLTVVLEDIDDPHNVMAILRSCDAVGVFEVQLVGRTAKKFKRERLGKRSSSGAKKWLEFNQYESIEACFENLKKREFTIYSTKLHDEVPSVSLFELDLAKNCALVFGNEHDGVSKAAYEGADLNFEIPQFGMTQSLNVSVACAVSLYESCRQRLLKGLFEKSQFSEAEYIRIEQDWMAR